MELEGFEAKKLQSCLPGSHAVADIIIVVKVHLHYPNFHQEITNTVLYTHMSPSNKWMKKICVYLKGNSYGAHLPYDIYPEYTTERRNILPTGVTFY